MTALRFKHYSAKVRIHPLDHLYNSDKNLYPIALI